jgi:DNA adenine methylase
MTKPIVKWAGGKSKLLPALLPHVPTHIRTYAEPFAGGAALFFALAGDPSRTVERAVLADQNEDLIACYRAVRDDVEALIVALSDFTHDEDLYYRVRDLDPSGMSDLARGARLMFLNRTCFNGLWRVNKSGKFNVPFGKYANPRIVDPDGLRDASSVLAKADVRVADFADVTRELGPGDFVYFDPPYVPLTKSASFTSYAQGGFGPADQERLAAELVRLKDKGVLAMLSNADTDVTRALYKDFTIHATTAARAINSRGSGRGHAKEIIVTTWDSPAPLPEAAPPKTPPKRAARVSSRA